MTEETGNSNILHLPPEDRNLVDKTRQHTDNPDDWLEWLLVKLYEPLRVQKKGEQLIERYPLIKRFPSSLALAAQLVYPQDSEQNIRALAIVLVNGDTDNAARICENYALALESQLKQVQLNSFWGVQRAAKGKILNDNFVLHSDYKFIPDLWRKLPAITFTDQHRQLITEAVQKLDEAFPPHF